MNIRNKLRYEDINIKPITNSQVDIENYNPKLHIKPYFVNPKTDPTSSENKELHGPNSL